MSEIDIEKMTADKTKWVDYQNGNYHVWLNLEDGTKIRHTDDDEFKAAFPESMDIKTTNKCSMGCPMCFVVGTKILMGDLTYKNIEDIQIGDIVMGFEEYSGKFGAKRKMMPTKVLNTFIHVESELVRVTTEESSVTATPNHPFLSEGTGANHSRFFNQIGRIEVGKYLFNCGFPIDDIDYDSKDYKIGYLVGSWTGDGSYQHYIDKNGYDVYNCRFVTKDEEINDKVYELTKEFIPDFYRLDFKMAGNGVKSSVRSNKKSSYETICSWENDNMGENNTKEYACGFLGGFCDSEGHVDNQRSIIRLTNTNYDYIKEIKRCFEILGLDYVEESRDPWENNHSRVYVIRLKGTYGASRFLWYTRPVCYRKSLENYLLKHFQHYKRELLSKEIINKKQYVYNMETECHTYIANNFLVHNCHEDSRPDGKHSDIDQAFLDTLHPYQEIAVGGGNVLEHPGLDDFLLHLNELKCIPSITVNQVHFMQEFDRIKKLYDDGLVYGIGVSLTNAHQDGFIERLQQLPTAVIHTIVGLLTPDDVKTLAGHNLKVLILGYKDIRRGHDYLSKPNVNDSVKRNTAWVAMNLPQMMRAFKVLSFDNLALEQLPVRQVVGEEVWQQFYMGDDGRHTFYIDMVEKQFARSSTSMNRHDIGNMSVDEMFQIILSE